MNERSIGQIARVLSPSPPPFVPTFRALSPSVISSGTDVNWGGKFKIAGTVKEQGSPNQPVFRRVVLHDQPTGLVVRSMWSNAVTGAYSFNGIKAGVYYVVSFDHTKNFRAVIADGQIPEAM